MYTPPSHPLERSREKVRERHEKRGSLRVEARGTRPGTGTGHTHFSRREEDGTDTVGIR